MASKQDLVLSRRRAGVQVPPAMDGLSSSAKIFRIKFSASSTALSARGTREDESCNQEAIVYVYNLTETLLKCAIFQIRNNTHTYLLENGKLLALDF